VKHSLFILLCVFSAGKGIAQHDNNLNLNAIPDNGKWSSHFQFTGIMQGHPDFQSLYSGQNSLSNKAEQDFSVTSTLFLGRKLWKGAAFFVNPEIAGGKGFSSTLGIAGFTNGECFRIGDPSPALYLGRAFLRQQFALSNSCDTTTDGTNLIGGTLVPCKRITVTAGKFSLADMFDNNPCSHDPRSQFMNWGLMSNGAWDYPANTRGYTWGLVVELITPTYAIRIAETTEPKVANGSEFDWNISRARGETVEFEKDFKIKGHKGAVRLLGFRNPSRGGSYRDAINNKLNGTDTTMNVNSLTSYGRLKYGCGLSADLGLTNNTSLFFRTSWNDGHTASWAFTEIDQSLSCGISIKGKKWKRSADVVGIAFLMNNISNDHWDFLNNGGYGFLIGDGQLPHYGSELIGECYYNFRMTTFLWVTADYQYVQNPAYNRDRGPVNVWSIRGHVEF
jgi:high affinity Mn2+ porin